jgi:hypothetical protein
MKYLIYTSGHKRIPVLFPDGIHHRDMDEMLDGLLQFRAAILTSAGKVRLHLDDPTHVICYDYSHGFNLHPDEDDEETIEQEMAFTDRVE